MLPKIITQLDFLVGGGEMGKLIGSMDWSKTPLGAIEFWPQSLRTTVSLCLASNFPISIAWGAKHTQIYNDGYWPICGGKHPVAMGQDYTECWASAWPAIGEAFHRGLAGEASYIENQRMFVDRNGYLEETFFTFSFSPIRDESGGVGGLFHPVTEQTNKMLSERRTHALRDLTVCTGKAKAIDNVFIFAAQTLSEYELDLPFVLFYRLDVDGGRAQLIAHSGFVSESHAKPSFIDLKEPCSLWPLDQAMHLKGVIQVDNLEQKFGPVICGPYPDPLNTAFILPIFPPGSERPIAFLIVGVSTRLPCNETYRGFYDLIASTVTAAVANAHAYEDARRRAEALAELDRAKTTFFNNISHEFRTPLALMLGPIEDALGEASSLPQTQRERLDIAHRNALRLLKLVNTLLDFSRIEAGRTQASFEPVDISAYTAELASNFRSICEKAGVNLVIDCPPLPELVYIDNDMWEKIVLNLISNAFKFTFEGQIKVSLCVNKDNNAELIVCDTGTGISEKELPRLFERFHRIEGAEGRTYEGSGIGLALVHELTKLHGGTITVESKIGQGSAFHVSIPFGTSHLPLDQIHRPRTLTSTAVRANSFVEEAARWLPTTVSDNNISYVNMKQNMSGDVSLNVSGNKILNNANRPQILFADDNADMRSYVARLLSEGGYAVYVAADGEEALSLVRSGKKFDLVLSDIMMPKLDGYGLLHALRSDPLMEGLLVILLSAQAGEEARVEGLAAGADDYLVKPFSARELIARVEGALRLAKLRQEGAARERDLHAEIVREQGRAVLRETEKHLIKQLSQSNQDLERFAYAAAHDLKTPLRSIDNLSQWIEEDVGSKLDGKSREHMHKLRSQVSRMEKLLDDVLEYSRIERKIRPHEIEILDGAQLMESIIALISPPKEFSISYQGFDSILMPRMPLQQILHNLIGNAIKHHDKSSGQVEVSVEDANTHFVFRVCDDGPGIAPEYHQKIFEMFQTLKPRFQKEGSGMGLALVKKLITMHDGEVNVESKVGQGACFKFSWPKKVGEM